jgi:transposase
MNSIGIDYHKRYSVLSVLNAEGKEEKLCRIEHSYPELLVQVIADHAPCQVAFESTMNWGWLYDLLEEIPGLERIVMANPLHVRLIAAAQVKTDKIDARKLATLLRVDLLPASHIPDKATRARKEVLRQRTFLVRERTKVRNRIHRLLGRQHGLAMPKVSDLFGKKGMSALRKLSLAEPDAMLLNQQLELLDLLGKQIRELEKQIAADGEGDDATQWLSSMPGIGVVLGNVIATEIDGVTRFGQSGDLVAYAGLIPSTSSSGDKTYHGRLVPGCNKWLRWAFVEAAWVAVGCSPDFGDLYHHHRQRGKKANTAILIVARRMCQIAYRILTEHRPYEPRPVAITHLPGRSQKGRTEQAA